MANKTIKFNTKLIQDNKVYLPLSDVVKALGYKQNDFVSKYPTIIEDVYGVLCVRETDYNNLLAENASALEVQGQIEVTKIETLRNKIDCVLSFQTLKFALMRDYLQIMATRTGCKSVEEYILIHEIPEEKQKALTELIQVNESNASYKRLVEHLKDKKKFNVDIIRNFGLDIQYLTSIEADGHIHLDAYVVGRGIFYNTSEIGDYALWNEMYADDNGDIILPYYDYDSIETREININLSQIEIDRDFRQYNVIDNMLWCIDNLNVNVLEDYESSVFSMYEDTIRFDMPVELLVKLLKPELVNAIYIDKIIDIETDLCMTDFDSEKVFVEDYDN